MIASKKVRAENDEPAEDPAIVQAGHLIEGETCPRCHGGRIRSDIRNGRWVGRGPTREYRCGTSRSCMECWHQW